MLIISTNTIFNHHSHCSISSTLSPLTTMVLSTISYNIPQLMISNFISYYHELLILYIIGGLLFDQKLDTNLQRYKYSFKELIFPNKYFIFTWRLNFQSHTQGDIILVVKHATSCWNSRFILHFYYHSHCWASCIICMAISSCWLIFICWYWTPCPLLVCHIH